jgi:hypothetical protein
LEYCNQVSYPPGATGIIFSSLRTMQIRGAKVVHGGVEVQELPSPPAASSSKTSPQLFFRNAFPNVGYTKKKLPTLWLDFVKKNPAQASKNRVLITKTKNRTNIHGIYNISIKYPMSHTMDI